MIKRFIKSNPVFMLAGIAAIISMFFVPPNAEYISYIDFRTVVILLSQLMIIEGLMKSGVFDFLSGKIVKKFDNTRSLSSVLILLCFFVSMLVTNDVSLISFVPLTIILLSKINDDNLMIFVIVFETIAANLGSMLMPFGNPQNLFLFNISGISGLVFIMLMLKYTFVSLGMIMTCCILIPKKNINDAIIDPSSNSHTNIAKQQSSNSEKQANAIEFENQIHSADLTSHIHPTVPKSQSHSADSEKLIQDKDLTVDNAPSNKKLEITGSLILLIICIMTVFHIGNEWILIALCLSFFLLIDKNILKNVNYILPLTFVEFFILTGNIKALPQFSETLSKFITGHEMITGVLLSQIISNVPAAMLLSSFTDDYKALIIGTDIGGLGTLIASMASLISFQFYSSERDSKPGKYLLVFTLMNVIFLIMLLLISKI